MDEEETVSSTYDGGIALTAHLGAKQERGKLGLPDQEKAIGSIAMALEELESVLTPILTAPYPENKISDTRLEPDKNPESEVKSRIHSNNRQLSRIEQQIKNLIKRIDL